MGRETIRMEELTVRAGLARPEIFETTNCVTVRFSPTRYVPPQRVAQDVSSGC
jgi:ATP-dependent DNA helicase RecG